MSISDDKKEELIRFLKRRGWIDIPFASTECSVYEPLEEEIADILEIFFAFHEQEKEITPTGLGGAFLSQKKIFMISYKPLGWENDEKEYYDTISKNDKEYMILTHNVFLREVGPEFAPNNVTLEKLSILNRLCTRYGNRYIDSVPADDREYFEWYLKIAVPRIPKIEERHFRNNTISDFCSFSVLKDLYRTAYLTSKDDIILEDWDRQKKLPPQEYHDKLFLEVFKKLKMENLVLKVLDDLWTRGEPWALFRLLDRIKNGFVIGRKGLKLIPLIEGRLLSIGERISGDWNRTEMMNLLELSRGEFPKHLFDDET